MPQTALAPHATIAVIGAGRLGGVLARSLAAAGFDVRGPVRRGEPIPDAALAILCVPDTAIPDAARAARPHADRVAHVSGATQLTDADLSIHPLQTFTGAERPEVFEGIAAAVDGRTAADRDIARHLAMALGATPVAVDDAHRAGYHAAASVASNFVLTVLDAAEQLAVSAGVDRAHLAPLVRQTVENWVESGAGASLTGPIVRGDEATVARQRTAVDEVAPHLTPLFDALADATRSLAGSSIPTASAAETPSASGVPAPSAYRIPDEEQSA